MAEQNAELKVKEKLVDARSKRMNFYDVVTASDRIQSQCKDYFVTKPSNGMLNVRMEDTLKMEYKDDNGGVHNSTLSPFALSQLCTKIGVPVSYVNKCVDNGDIDLAVYNINSWLEDFSGGFFVREYNESVRGILSPRYSCLDTPDILEYLMNTLNMENFVMRGYYITDERLHLRVTHKDRLDVTGEDLFTGIQLDSSDVGKSSLSVRFYVFRQVCTNGLCVPYLSKELFKQKHIGIVAEEFQQDLVSAIQKIGSLSGVFEEMVAKNCETITREQTEVLYEQARKELMISEKQMENLQELVKLKYADSNRWSVANAITEFSQKFTLERRIIMENYAGSLLLAS